jgi:subtilisin family serine protease
MTDPNPSSQAREPVPPGPVAPADPFVRFDARALDPGSAVRLADGIAPLPTAYRGDRLLITARTIELARQVIADVDRRAAEFGLTVADTDPFEIRDENERDDEHNRLARLLSLAVQTNTPLVFPIRLARLSDQPAAAVDVWPLLQNIRAAGDDALAAAVGLDHLMFSAATIVGNPFGARATAFISGNPFGARATSVIAGNPFGARATSAVGVEGYLYPGSGGRGPVSVVLPEPIGLATNRPRVVVLDTGVGEHPWFVQRPVDRSMKLSTGDVVGVDVALPDAIKTDPEGAGALPDPMTGTLASHAGHGTFIAGLLRQTCPDADISVLRIMDADGVVPESTLTTALLGIAIKIVDVTGAERIDALVLSLGYYAETPEDQVYSAGLRDLLLCIAERGAVTFAAAGNDSTRQRSYPAGFADDPAFDSYLPLVAVAALNPNRTIALFSNDGKWVRGAAVAANIVSTAPITEQGSYQPAVALDGSDGRRRATIDQDDYSSGFATWSGTSFAAPVLAGHFLRRLAEESLPTVVSERRALIPLRRT